jgi:predicted glycosyl hydrolase (DUF1957 family)
MTILAYLGSLCTKFQAAGWKCYVNVILFRIVYLSCCDLAMDPIASVHQILCERDPRNDSTSVWGRSISYTQRVQTYRDLKKAKQAQSKVNSMFITFFDIKGIVHKEFVLAGQTVNSACYCYILQRVRENVRRFHSEFWL